MTILDEIIERKKIRVKERKIQHPFFSLDREDKTVRHFPGTSACTLIAECKKGSPSKGIIAGTYEPAVTAAAYEKGGASAVSVLTEEDFFFGSDDHFSTVRKSIALPMIRKDFVFDEYQIKESWSLGADAVLLIAAALDDYQLKDLYAAAREFRLAVLAEAHDEAEIERMLALPDALIGVNARNLKDFSVHLDLVASMRKRIPIERIAVAESGINSIASAISLRDAGYNSFLVGEYFMRSDNPEVLVHEFTKKIGTGI